MCETPMGGTALNNQPINRLPDNALDSIAAALKAWTITPSGTEGYRKAEVALGGVDTAGLSSKTMESVKAPGLFFTGEAVDVTGPLGGYNFQWAWASGFCAGQYA
ncbi:aminoacetone oxidase family FAD-binding enzyme, partial [SAR202 cluster bacterium AD-802-F09_MRT_200m]|nr:aminoacetone oxidase family FAD-binding enzyme [SAR202 cluster bacterium AD-802-F09_MRT_200m]